MVEVLADPVGVQLWRLGETELLQLVTGLSTWCTQLEALRLRAVAEVEHRGSARAVGATGTARWLTQATRITPGAPNRALELAVALQGAPAVSAALATGQISVAHAQVIMSTLAGLPRDLPEQGRADCASYLLLAATGEDPTVLARRGTGLTHRLHPESVADMEQRAVTRRELRIGTTPVDGLVPITGWLDTEAAELARAVLSPLAAPRPRTDTERDLRSPAHRLTDAFAELCQRAADHQCVPGEGYTRPHLTLTIDATTLSTGHGPAAALPLLGPLSAAATRRVACDAEITPITLDEHLVPLDVGPGHLPRHRWATTGVDRPRPRVRIPRLRQTTRVVPRPPHPALDRRRTHRTHQPRTPLRIPPPGSSPPRVARPPRRRRTPLVHPTPLD